MKHLPLALLFSLLGFMTSAKDGYDIKITFKQDIPDSFVYLAHYFGKPMPTVYKTDSAQVVNKRTAVFKKRDNFLGGIYLVLFDNRSKFFEFILDNGAKIEIIVDTLNLPVNNVYKNSPENTNYVAYQSKLMELGSKQYDFGEALKVAATKADSQAIYNKMQVVNEELRDYRKDYVKKHPNTYLSAVLNALLVPETPAGPHYLEDGKTIDSNFSYYYYKEHFWDNFNFNDDRLINSPVLDGKLSEYFNRLVVPVPDSMNAEADKLLSKAPKGSEIFKYCLHWMTRNAETSNVMGMDEAFVHLVENYYMQGDAFWLDSAGLAKYEERAQKIAPNVLGNTAPDLKLQDIWSLQDVELKNVDAEYTLMVFWSVECGHCKKEVPAIDSVYNAVLKEKGVKVYAVSTEGDLQNIQKFVNEKGFKHWINVVDAHNNSGYRSKYDIYATPKVYLLDRNKVIIGKGLDHNNIQDVLDWYEGKNKNK